ncbi:hypothetical protein WJX72_005035 [[Myrmecia] bisecta]|uniref:DUF1230 domain-containing protein n=1 Tax=[Myrmecia] bisecta TaxID=41462 RepID=A0AAW1PZY8_9CHLO
MAVPVEQRPVNELGQLQTGVLYSWATLDLQSYVLRLATIWALVFALIGGPIAYQTFDPFREPAEFFLSGSTGALLVVAVAVLRIYLGWAYVGNRLLSASVEYEETGWYDGQLFVKPPEVLARDRLLGSYTVKPVLNRLKTTLLASGGGLLLSAILLVGLITSGSDADGVYGRGAARAPRAVMTDGVLYSDKVKDLSALRSDDEAAAAEAAAQGGIPGYCGDRYFKAFAGGQYCAKFEGRPAGRK